MTMLVPALVKCAVCGKGNQVMIMKSTSRFGACDLDTRPPAMFRFTIFLQHCIHCGYVNHNITEGNDSIKDLLETELYTNCDGINPANETAKHFIQHAIIQAHSNVESILNNTNSAPSQEYILMCFLNAAWACDDSFKANPEQEKYNQDAIECRKRCLKLIDSVIVKIQDSEHKETMLGIKADLLRRTSQFETVITEYENKVFENPYIDQVIRFEIDLAKNKDTKAYNMQDIDLVKYPLKEQIS